jgi:glycosyltransferase involved in cell wall biosynthesis
LDYPFAFNFFGEQNLSSAKRFQTKRAIMAEKQRTLVLLTPGFARDEADTTCIPVLQFFVRCLKKQNPGLQVIILAFQYPFSAGEYGFHGARVISFNGRNRRKVFRWLVWVKVWMALTRLQRQYRVIGLLSFWFTECAFIGHLFAWPHRLKHFCWLLGQDARPGNRFFSFIKPPAGSLIVLSDAMAGELLRNYSLKAGHVIPFGVDAAVFPAGPQERNEERNIDIMGAGSLISLKRYDLFLDVVERLTEKFPGLRVVLCGKGPEKARLLERLEKGQLHRHVTLLDEVPHARVLALMRQSRIFLHTSAYEGFAAVCAEALYAGAQVVSFCQPIHQPIAHWHIVGSEAELLERLVLLLSQKELSHESVLPFTMEGTCSRIMELFGYQGSNHQG